MDKLYQRYMENNNPSSLPLLNHPLQHIPVPPAECIRTAGVGAGGGGGVEGDLGAVDAGYCLLDSGEATGAPLLPFLLGERADAFFDIA